jgi:hypothetical protein
MIREMSHETNNFIDSVARAERLKALGSDFAENFLAPIGKAAALQVHPNYGESHASSRRELSMDAAGLELERQLIDDYPNHPPGIQLLETCLYVENFSREGFTG